MMSRSDFSVKVKRHTKKGRQIQKHTIPSLTSQGGTNWHTKRVIDFLYENMNIKFTAAGKYLLPVSSILSQSFTLKHCFIDWFRALHNESNTTCHVFRGLNSPHRCRITSFSRLKRISQSGQDTLFIFDLLCLLNNKTKQKVFNWTQQKVFLNIIWSRCQPSFLFFSRSKCALKLPGLDIWIVISIQ